MDGGADAVAGAVDEVVGITGFSDDCAGYVVDLSAFDGLVGGELLADEGDGGVSCLADDCEDFALLKWDVFTGACEGHPGIVGEDRVWGGEACPEVEEYEVSRLDGAVVGGGGFVVGI